MTFHDADTQTRLFNHYILALNARIEAARAGEHGRGIAVEAQKMAESVASVESLTVEMETASANILAVSDKINTALENLKVRDGGLFPA